MRRGQRATTALALRAGEALHEVGNVRWRARSGSTLAKSSSEPWGWSRSPRGRSATSLPSSGRITSLPTGTVPSGFTHGFDASRLIGDDATHLRVEMAWAQLEALKATPSPTSDPGDRRPRR